MTIFGRVCIFTGSMLCVALVARRTLPTATFVGDLIALWSAMLLGGLIGSQLPQWLRSMGNLKKRILNHGKKKSSDAGRV